MTRVLVVDDSRTQAEQARLVLDAAGFTVEVAASGEEALERMVGGAFDLVLSDVMMPGITGYELCRAAKAAAATRDLPVVLLTSLDDPLEVIRALECGADGFITKDLGFDQLVQRVRTVVENQRLRAGVATGSSINVHFLGRTFPIQSERQQILDLLVSTFEDTVRKQQELTASQRQLREANRELEAFSAAVAHDLGAPLRAINHWAGAILSDGAGLDDAGKQHASRVLEAAQRMGQIIEDLLRLSRVAKATLNCTDFDLSAIARLVAANLTTLQPDHAVELVIRPGMRCHGDRALVLVVLENLLGNAWKFTRKQSAPRVEVGAEIQAGATVFFVRDNGAGFDMARADRLFLPFERLHSDAEFKGTGVGLTTARRVIERHGGRIWAEAAAGRGATFFFTVPVGRS
ncbi:MAG TPA: response regulator [Kofleriaceae bacterium]|nr:response regulator [Kofleriaceae bacterium]